MTLQVPKIQTATYDDLRAGYALLNPVVRFYHLLLPLTVVEALYAEWEADGLEVWLVVNGATSTDRERIFEQEWALMQAFPGFGLDVHLLDRQETDPNMVTNLEHADVFLRFPQPTHA